MHLFYCVQFGTTFEEMDAMSGRRQTTKGIWLAKGLKIQEPATLVLDLEGSDGRERGEDDNSFERQSSLFALAVADVLLVNMWAKDVGREAGAGKPLLKTIFQVRHGRQHATSKSSEGVSAMLTEERTVMVSMLMAHSSCRSILSSSPQRPTNGGQYCCLSSGTAQGRRWRASLRPGRRI